MKTLAENHGLTNLKMIYYNLPAAQLVEMAVQGNEGILTSTGALNVTTGKRTGRSPKDKYIVDEPATHDGIWWGEVNKPFPEEAFEMVCARVRSYLMNREVFVLDSFVNAHPIYRKRVRVITKHAWQCLFARQLFIRVKPDEVTDEPADFTVIHVPNFLADPAVDGTSSEAFILVHFGQRLALIGGTQYAGEIKKSVFTAMNYFLPDENVFPMHCSANMGDDGDVALFFGLSGTGKTTISADPDRHLIGDDEHGWSDEGVFNMEGGCYAKCIRLSREAEPQIWNALRFGSVLENVVVDPITREPNFDDESITENTRAAYPVHHISNAVESGVGGQPSVVILLTADAFGVLPPVAKLTPEQARYHFLSGYTARLAGTEAGMSREPEPTFSTCFGSPFIPRNPRLYATMLGERLKKHNARCYLVNTGWVGGPAGVGERIKIKYSRAMVRAVLDGRLEEVEFQRDPIFNLLVPKTCPDVPPELLESRATWADKELYDQRAKHVAGLFVANFRKFPDAPREVVEAGPHP